jgi:creatinine amidohydrolase/Fe(II)-dependent formamide hydrolase-like protein
MELTTPEVEQYLAGGGKTALLPVGSVEMHGPHQPIGTDTLIAKAFALRIAEQADGLVIPGPSRWGSTSNRRWSKQSRRDASAWVSVGW